MEENYPQVIALAYKSAEEVPLLFFLFLLFLKKNFIGV